MTTRWNEPGHKITYDQSLALEDMAENLVYDMDHDGFGSRQLHAEYWLRRAFRMGLGLSHTPKEN